MKHLFTCAVVTWLLVGLPVAWVRAGTADAIKDAMRQRLPAIEAMKSARVVGENSRGYLEFVDARREKEDVVAAENTDRAKAYAEIAARTGATPEQVGKQRAAQISERATAGTMLQDAAGKWVGKK